MTQWVHFWEYIQETLNTSLKEYKHPYIRCSTIYNRQDLEAAQMPISRWVDKKAVVHLHSRNFTICDSRDGPGDYNVKWSSPVWERKTPYDFTYMWNQMNKIN